MTFEKVNNGQIPYDFEQSRPGDNAFVVADNSLVKSSLYWKLTRNIEEIYINGWN